MAGKGPRFADFSFFAFFASIVAGLVGAVIGLVFGLADRYLLGRGLALARKLTE